MKRFVLRAVLAALILLLLSFAPAGIEGRPSRDCTCGAEGEMSQVMWSDSPAVGDTDTAFQRWRFGWPLRAAHLYVAYPYDEMVWRLRIAPRGVGINFALCLAMGIVYAAVRHVRRNRAVAGRHPTD